MFIDK